MDGKNGTLVQALPHHANGSANGFELPTKSLEAYLGCRVVKTLGETEAGTFPKAIIQGYDSQVKSCFAEWVLFGFEFAVGFWEPTRA